MPRNHVPFLPIRTRRPGAGHTIGALLLLALLFHPSLLAAQEASLNGTVRGPDGEPVGAAMVELIHLPSEVSSQRITTAEGRYNFSGLVPGDAYSLVVRATGYTTAEEEEIRLDPGEERTLDLTLLPPDFLLDAIDIVVDRRFDTQLSGPVIQITREEVTAHPTTERNFMELATLSPIAVQTSDGGEISISGQNERHNSILVDGSMNQDVFGASPSGVPGAAARAKPIPLDAIEQFRIEAAPFDVGVSGFTGGVMNAMTRRGTDTWEGSFFTEYRNQHFFGNLELDGVNVAPEEFSKHVWGFNVGGPIVRDRAHFFIATEFEDRSEPSLGFIDGIHDPLATGLLPDSVAHVRSLLQDQYGMDPGTPGQVSLGNPLSNVFARLDWQLSESQTLALRHNYSGAARDSMPNRSPVGAYEFASAGFRSESTSHAFTARLTSEFGAGHANQLSANLQRIREEALPASEDPLVDVTLRGAVDGTSVVRDVRAGSRYFSQQSALDQTIFQLTNRLVLDRDDVQMNLGIGLDYFSFHHDHRPGSRGFYHFRELADLETNDPIRYEVLLTDDDPGVDLTVAQPHIFFQNEHSFPDGLVLSYGVRMDVPLFRADPEYNEAIDEAFGMRTDRLPDVSLTFSPRLGFNWQPETERRTQLRGTFGVFTANLPYAWMADAIRHTGHRNRILTCDRVDGDGVRFGPKLDPSAPPPTTCPDGSNAMSQARVVGFREDFRLPRELKITMALDQELPGGFLLTTEALFIPTFSRTAVRDLNLPNAGASGDRGYSAAFGDRAHYGFAQPRGYGFDRRLDDYSQVLQIENEKRAALAWSTTFQLERDFARWLTLTGSATFSRTYDEQSLTFGDMATNLGATPIGRIAAQYTARPANFDRPRKYLLSARMRAPESIGGARVTLVYVGQSGQPYSYVYNSDINGDGFPGPGIPLDASNDLLWVPDNPTDIPGTLVTKQLFAQFVNDVEECLFDVRGAIMERNSCRTPSVHMVDLSVSQPISVGGLRFEVNADLLNVLNVVNSDWGQVWEVDPVVPILDIVARSDFGTNDYVPSSEPLLGFTGPRVRDPESGTVRPGLPHNLVVPASQWQAQVGMRVYF